MVNEAQPGDVALTVISARANLAWCDLLAGKLDPAEATAREVIADATARGWASLLQLRPAFIALATSSLLRGDAEVADRAVAAGLAAVVGGVEWWPTVALHLTQASIAVSRNRPRAAIAALTTALAHEQEVSMSLALIDIQARVLTEVAWLTANPSFAVVVQQDKLERASGRQRRGPTKLGPISLAVMSHEPPRPPAVCPVRRSPLTSSTCSQLWRRGSFWP